MTTYTIPGTKFVGNTGHTSDHNLMNAALAAVVETLVTVPVPAPTGATATDTPNIATAIANLGAALSFGPAALEFGDGLYQIDSNSAVIRSLSNFVVKSAGRTTLQQAPNRAGLPNNTGGDLMVIADCTDFRVDPSVTFDGNRDVVAPITPLTASASSGQPSVTVAAGNGARYQVGQYLAIMGGVGSSDQNTSDGFKVGAGGIGLQIASITPGGGSGGGDLITFSSNLAHSYTQTGGTALSDGFGPYAWTTDYLTPYQCAPANSVAGRSLSGEDQQCGLHLISCQRFAVTGVTARNVWESPIKLGTGFATTSLTDGCQQGTVTDCAGYHGYDQGVSIWVGNHVTVKGCVMNAAGWAGICMTGSDACTVTANQVLNSVYQVPGGLGEGSGIVTEGGVRNSVSKNIITGVYEDGVRIDASPLPWGVTTNNPTLSAFLPAQTAAGASIQISTTAALVAGGLYSILDGIRTEAVTVATIVDGTHVTLAQPTLFSHASGVYLSVRVAQENTFEGNLIFGPQTGNGVTCLQGVRNRIKNNTIANWSVSGGGTGNGIVLNYGTLVGSTGYSGGYGTEIEGNVIGGGTSQAISANWVNGLLIRGNRLYGPSGSGPAVNLKGVYDSVVEGNHISDVFNGQGVLLQAGGPSNTVQCVRVTVSGNMIRSTSAEGINAQNADSCIIDHNNVASCGGSAGIYLKGVTRCVVDGNVSNSNAADGILLADNGAAHCLYNRVVNNTCRDDGSGVNVTTGAAQTQQHGIVESGNSNYNIITGNECDSNAVDQLTTVGAATVSTPNIISGAITSAAQNYGGLFGDSSDGSANLNGTNTVAWASLAGSTYTMSRDCFVSSLTIGSGVTLVTGASGGGRWRIFCAAGGTVTINSGGSITANGNNASGATAGAALGGGTLDGSGAGGGGTTGTGGNGSVPSNGSIVGTGAGGNGGAGTPGAAGSGGATNSANGNNWLHLPATLVNAVVGVSANVKMLSGASGGGAGGGDGTNAGGGGGGGGGCIGIMAGAVVNNGTISAAGGNGANGVAGNAGGGGGGGGGLILVFTLSAWTAGTTSVAGGSAGSGSGTGSAGVAGGSGQVVNVVVQ